MNAALTPDVFGRTPRRETGEAPITVSDYASDSGRSVSTWGGTLALDHPRRTVAPDSTTSSGTGRARCRSWATSLGLARRRRGLLQPAEQTPTSARSWAAHRERNVCPYRRNCAIGPGFEVGHASP